MTVSCAEGDTGHIYDGLLETAISDLEVEQKEVKGNLWYFKYPVEGQPGRFLTVATTQYVRFYDPGNSGQVGNFIVPAYAVRERCPDYPTLPSICNWINRFISMAYSIGNSLTSGSMNPFTIIVLASCSVSPRLSR